MPHGRQARLDARNDFARLFNRTFPEIVEVMPDRCAEPGGSAPVFIHERVTVWQAFRQLLADVEAELY